jgi:hypothetical protein
VAAALVVAAGIDRLGRRSGATDAEVAARLPGDEIVREPMWETTRAITIRASPDEVWPWIVQMGFPAFRAGWYTPRWLDRAAWGITAPSADEIVPELQRLGTGDLVPDSPDWSVFFTVRRLEPGRALVLHSTRHVLAPYSAVDFSWAFVLAGSPGATRLVIRARARWQPVWPRPLVRLFWLLVMGPADFLNAGGMLRGIRRRAERGRSPGAWGPAVSGAPAAGNPGGMSADSANDLTGRWALSRVSGLLPPLGLLHKRIAGARGATAFGSLLDIPFRVRSGARGPVLVYSGPLGIVRDRLRRRQDGGWDGEATVLGIRIGRFRMTRRAPAGPPRRR